MTDAEIVSILRESANLPEITFGLPINNYQLLKVYKSSVSLFQRQKSRSGTSFEKVIVGILKKAGIAYREQVCIDNEGIILPFCRAKAPLEAAASAPQKSSIHKVDIVIGANIVPGKSITEFVVLSCKKTCRERWSQDAWTQRTPPRKYLLLTLGSDYPGREKFEESEVRKLLTLAKSRKPKDDYLHKLDYSDLLEELENADDM